LGVEIDAETFAVIGQWGQLISTLLVLAFAAYKLILKKILGPERASAADEETPAANGETGVALVEIR
jgi:hypothetical protein